MLVTRDTCPLDFGLQSQGVHDPLFYPVSCIGTEHNGRLVSIDDLTRAQFIPPKESIDCHCPLVCLLEQQKRVIGKEQVIHNRGCWCYLDPLNLPTAFSIIDQCRKPLSA